VCCVRALACAVIIGAFAASPCAAVAKDLSPQPSAIANASIPEPSFSQEFAIGFPGLSPQGSSREPFDGSMTQPAQGRLLQKWNAAKTELRIDADIIAACRTEPEACESGAARRIIGIIEVAQKRAGRALIGEINRAVNLAITPASDKIQYGVEDRWASPLMTFTSGRGDCEDYALAKYAALRATGFTENDMRLLIVRLPQSQTDHAVLSVRYDGRWLVLDNRRFAMLDTATLDAVPLFVLRENDVGGPVLAADQERKTDWPLAFVSGEFAAGNTPNLM
jgi:predicted transglutaminase-like cysteine proteinase